MTFNLLQEEWIPVELKNGGKLKVSPLDITTIGNDSDDPIVRISFPRPDFNGSVVQFLIALLQSTLAPKNDRDWARLFLTPPSKPKLKCCYSALLPAFELFGEGPRFMQDYEILKGKRLSVDTLLVDTPGENTVKFNKDFFIKRSQIDGLCPGCVAAALFTINTHAPSGGVGYRTSLRGGGPLSTILIGDNLWQTLWLNVLNRSTFDRFSSDENRSLSDSFPWMAATRTSDKKSDGVDTTPLDTNSAQVYWSMPRRTRLYEPDSEGYCGICGDYSHSLVRQTTTTNYGVNYVGAWRHPLSPYSLGGDNTPIAKKGQAGCLFYRNWPTYALQKQDSKTLPAAVVTAHIRRHASLRHRALDLGAPRLWVYGFDCDNAKIRSWYDGIMPVHLVDESIYSKYVSIVEQLVELSSYMADSTRKCVAESMFRRPQDHRGEPKELPTRFWQQSDQDFYEHLDRALKSLQQGCEIESLKLSWHKVLYSLSESLFESYSQISCIQNIDPGRIARAWRRLRIQTSIKNKKVRKALDLHNKLNKGEQ